MGLHRIWHLFGGFLASAERRIASSRGSGVLFNVEARRKEARFDDSLFTLRRVGWHLFGVGNMTGPQIACWTESAANDGDVSLLEMIEAVRKGE